MSNIHILNKENSVLNEFLREIRDVNIQNDPLRFQKNMERIGAVIGLEISKKLSYTETEISTPLDTCKVKTLQEKMEDMVVTHELIEKPKLKKVKLEFGLAICQLLIK